MDLVPPPDAGADASADATVPARAQTASASPSSTPVPVGEWFAVDITSEAEHTCALKEVEGGHGGDLYCWGLNDHGQLGLGYANTTGAGCNCVPTMPTSPVLSGVAAVAVGWLHTCALFPNGTVQVATWGGNGNGQLGLGYANTTGCQCVLSAALIPSLEGVIAIASGTYHSCAVVCREERSIAGERIPTDKGGTA